MSDDCGEININTAVNHRLRLNYVNPPLYPVSVRNCPGPERGILCIFIGDLNSKSSLLLFTLLSARKPHFEKRPVIGNIIKYS